MKNCKECRNKFEPKYNSAEMFCSYECSRNYTNKKPKKNVTKINKFSKKRKSQNDEYLKKRKIFLDNLVSNLCPITGELVTDIHHKKGRIGFADDYARNNNIPLLLDERFWIALSRRGHSYVEQNPEWAKLNGYSLDRK